MNKYTIRFSENPFAESKVKDWKSLELEQLGEQLKGIGITVYDREKKVCMPVFMHEDDLMSKTMDKKKLVKWIVDVIDRQLEVLEEYGKKNLREVR